MKIYGKRVSFSHDTQQNEGRFAIEFRTTFRIKSHIPPSSLSGHWESMRGRAYEYGDEQSDRLVFSRLCHVHHLPGTVLMSAQKNLPFDRIDTRQPYVGVVYRRNDVRHGLNFSAYDFELCELLLPEMAEKLFAAVDVNLSSCVITGSKGEDQ